MVPCAAYVWFRALNSAPSHATVPISELPLSETIAADAFSEG